MKSHRTVLTLHVPERMGFVNITRDVEAALAESGIGEGLCLVNAMHITASVFVNDDEPGLLEDYARWLEEPARSLRCVACRRASSTCASDDRPRIRSSSRPG